MQKLAVVYFPDINLDEINNFRQKYDPNWKIIKPHITVIFPLSEISEDLNSIENSVKTTTISYDSINKENNLWNFATKSFQDNHNTINILGQYYLLLFLLLPYIFCI